jgi:predicted transcriptional regulator
MKIKRIRIKSKLEFASELRGIAKKMDERATPKKAVTGEFFESLDAVRVILTDKRLELWRTIRDQKPGSISEVAELVDRGFKAVYRDLQLLEGLGLITFKKGKGKRGDVQAPVSLVDELQLAVA